MGYGVRWFSEFDDIHENVVYRVEVRERDYAGAATEVLSDGEPLVIDMAKVDNVFTPLRPQKATVKWMSQEGVDFQISDLFIDDDKKYQLHVFEDDGGTLIPRWVGWVVPIELEEPFASKPYTVTFSATCGLPFLSDEYVLDAFGSFVLGEKSLAEVIANCLTRTGLELEIDTYVSLLAEGMSAGSPFPQAEIDADGLRGKYADEVLSGILAPFRAYITQANGRWVIKGTVEQNALESTRVRFSATGSPIGTAMVNQSAGIGRTPYSSGAHLRPTAEVIEKIAEPNSIITETVSPGIPVNRLPNGLFAGPVLGGNIPGWNNHIGSIPWSRMGSNKPDDPYRIEFYQHIEFDPKKKKRAFKPFVYFDSGPIYLNLGDFHIPDDRRKETKIVLSGAFKSNNSLSATFMLSVNEDEREKNDYLDDNGEWFYSGKEDRTYNKRSSQSKYEPTSKGYNDLELQTFEIESKRIKNLLNRPEGAVVVLRLRIFPAIQGPGYNGGNIFFSLEDLALIVVEDSVFEGEHKYQINAHLPIRNANEVEYTSIIADKIDIDTPEQSRDVNRVMTGYMTLSGTSTLTKGWRYPGMVGYDPIQKLSLRITLRQLAGKRRTLEGSFLGYDVTPDISIFNRYDQPGIPSTFYGQTSWRWNVKDGTYDISATELNLFPLPTEDLYLYDDEEGRRGNRMYRGNSTSSSGTGGGTSYNPPEEIVLDDFDPIEYEILVEDEDPRVFDIGALIASHHTPNTLEAQILNYPSWISEIELYRGEDLDPETLPDDGILQVKWIGKPEKSGNYQINVELIGPDAEDYILVIPIIVNPSDEFTEEWPPVFDPFPILYFQVDKDSTAGFLITDYMTTDHVNLSYRFLGLPDWIIDKSVVFDQLSMTGHPTQIETRKVTLEIKDAINRISVEELTLQVIEGVEITGELLDTSNGDAKVGDLPGAYEVIDQWDTPIAVTGLHDRVTITVKGGGDLGDELDVTKDFPLTSPVEEGVYSPFGDIGGTTAGVGQYTIEVTAYLGVNQTVQTFDLMLYDDEYLAKMRKYLTKGFDYVGEIMPDGATSFVYPGAVNARAEIHDIDFDEIYISLEKEGEVVGEQHLTDIDHTITWWFFVFDEDQELEPGLYTFPVRLLKEGVDVFKRTDKFTIEAKDAEPKPLLSLGTFVQGTTNVNILVDSIPLKGAEYDLPANYTIVFDGFGPDVKCTTGEWELLFERGGAFAEVDIQQFTGYPQSFPYTGGRSLIFGNKSSLKIGDIHQAPSRVLAKFTGRDADGKIVGIAQADFSFRVALDPEDYSGLRFLTIDRANDGAMTLIDPNVPKTGRQYFMPPVGFWWTVSVRSFGGIEFDAVMVKLSKIVGGVEQVAWVFGPDYIVLHNVGSVVTELTDDDKAYIFGLNPDNDDVRVVNRVGDNAEMPLDLTGGLGFWKITMIAYLASVEVSTLSATIELIEDVDPPIKDCCGDCECEGGGEWNGGADPEW
jgi:hypothetical protein